MQPDGRVLGIESVISELGLGVDKVDVAHSRADVDYVGQLAKPVGKLVHRHES